MVKHFINVRINSVNFLRLCYSHFASSNSANPVRIHDCLGLLQSCPLASGALKTKPREARSRTAFGKARDLGKTLITLICHDPNQQLWEHPWGVQAGDQELRCGGAVLWGLALRPAERDGGGGEGREPCWDEQSHNAAFCQPKQRNASGHELEAQL